MIGRSATIILSLMSALILYNTLLIGGGRGPFALYKSYWACHCNDTEEITENMGDVLEPNIIGTLSRSNDLPDDDICLASDPEVSDRVCKTKLPLRYINLLFSGSFIVESVASSMPDGLNIPFSSIIDDFDTAPPSGITNDLIRPPQNPIA